ncbi:MAG: type II toxin-antitoxin system RelE/ParE family toxin [Desulfobacteraceae bacterium]|nr:MAG: type II toxin-antitoxin system RelE/ParE family toxin [Desulfobacteraceae bacterium]
MVDLYVLRTSYTSKTFACAIKVDYIAQDKPSAANKWIHKVFLKVEQLRLNPEIGRPVPEINDRQFRELIYGNYRVIYHIGIRQISILTIRHGKQILPIDEIKEGYHAGK